MIPCIGNNDDPNCTHAAVWRRATAAGDDFFCDMHARRESNFDADNTALWARLDSDFKAQAIIGSPRSKEELRELRKAFKPIDLRLGTNKIDKPSTVKEFIELARAAGHDSLGIANDPEAIATLDAVTARRASSPYPEDYHPDPQHLPLTEATIVEGEISPDALFGASSAYNRDDDVVYKIKLVRKEPGNVEFVLTINGRVCGQMPFDNLIKAAVRIDPDHASGPEKQIQKLRKETAEAKAAMYDWQAKVMQLEELLKQYEAAEAPKV